MFGIYLIIGAFAGVMAGLFGIGGGVVIIPALAAIFLHHAEIPSDLVMQMAVGTSMGTVVITAASSMYAHHKRAAVIWPMVKMMIPGLMIGAILGAVVVRFVPSSFLRILFSVFLVITAMRMWKKTHRVADFVLSGIFVQTGSVLIGIMSSLLGVGGGTMLVPFLMRCNLDMREATGTSVACGLAVGFVASICFMVTGLLANVHLPDSTGYIYWPAFLGIAGASILFAPFGAALAHKLPRDMLKKIFAVFLLVMAADMMFAGR